MLEVEAAEEGPVVQQGGEVAAFHVTMSRSHHPADDRVARVQVALHSANEVVRRRFDKSGPNVATRIHEASLLARGHCILHADRPWPRLAADLDGAKDGGLVRGVDVVDAGSEKRALRG